MSVSIHPSVSIIVPAYNEEGVISRCIMELSDVMRKTQHNAEIIVVNDGSTDRTLMEARSMQKKYPSVRILSFARNYGKATALREGVKVARGETIALFDADLQYDPEDLAAMIDMLNYGPDVVTGRRDFQRYELTRTVFSKIYNRLLRLIFRLDVSDSNCGMKVLAKKAADLDSIFRYGTPLMVPILKMRGYRITETLVSLKSRETGESKFYNSRGFFGGWKHIKGVYYHSGMLLGLLASLPSEWSKSRNSALTMETPTNTELS